MEILHTMTPERAIELDVQIIVALMRRLGITEADLKPDELPSPEVLPAVGLAIITTPEGGLIVTMLDMTVAEALFEGKGKVRN